MFCPQCDLLRFQAAIIAGGLVARYDLPPEIIAQRAVELAQQVNGKVPAIHETEHHDVPDYSQRPTNDPPGTMTEVHGL